MEGIAKAKARGVYKGGASLAEDKKALVRDLYLKGVKPSQIIRESGVGKTSVFKIIKDLRHASRA